jgi:protein O-mannosyl-transferase
VHDFFNFNFSLISTKRTTLLISGLILVLVVLVYNPAARNGFINYDDNGYIYENPQVKAGLTPEGSQWAFTSFSMGMWHPVTWMSHMLDCELFGLDPEGHHLESVIMHGVSSALLFYILVLAFPSFPGSFLCYCFLTLLFALHPLRVESVAWASERKDVLSVLFGLLAMTAYVQYTKKKTLKKMNLVFLFYCLSLLCKPMLVTFPLLLLLLDVWPLNRFNGFLCNLSEKIPLLIPAGFSSVISYFAQQKSDAITDWQHLSLMNRMIHMVESYGWYLYKFFFPFRLTVYYPYQMDQIFLFHPLFCISCLVILGISCFSVTHIKKTPWLFTGWFWFLCSLLPVIGIIQVGIQEKADRYTYFPHIGLFIILGGAVYHYQREKQAFKKPYLLIAASLVVIFSYSLLTHQQILKWKNSITLWEDCLQVTNDNWVAHHNLAIALSDSGKTEDAILHYNKAIQINPCEKQSVFNLGKIYAENGKTDLAEEYYSKVLALDRNDKWAYYNLGVVCSLKPSQTVKAVKALRCFLEAIRLDPEFSEAYNNLACLYDGAGDVRRAKIAYQQALRLNPNLYQAYFNLGTIYRDEKKYFRAYACFKNAFKINPALAQDENNRLIITSCLIQSQQGSIKPEKND